MNVEVLDGCGVKCDEFVRRTPTGTPSHLPAWSEMVSGTFGHKTLYLVAREGGTVVGVLPLTQVRSRFSGNRMVSEAFSNYGGPLASSPAALDALYHRTVALATQHGCESIEFRNVEPLPYELHDRADKVAMRLPLPADPEELWRSFKPKVRKAEKSGITAEYGEAELLDDFYRVWTARMRQLGTPCYPRKLFRNIFDTFPQNCRVFVVRLDELTVGGAFAYSFNGMAQIRWAATLVEHNSLCPSNLLYWTAMKHYCLAGASTFDFGRCTVGSGSHRFKKQWGAEQVQLHYQYWVRPGHELTVVSPDSPKYRRKVAVWRRLPLWTTRLLGPLISGNLP